MSHRIGRPSRVGGDARWRLSAGGFGRCRAVRPPTRRRGAAQARRRARMPRDRRRRRQLFRRDRQGADARGARRAQRATLGSEREGTGVVIGDDGLILHDRLSDRRGRRCEGHRQPRPDVAGAQSSATTMRPGLGLVRAIVPLDVPAVALRRFGKLAEQRAGDDRQQRRRGRRHARLRRVAAAVHRKLGIPARPGDLHVAAHAQLERRGADRTRRQAARRRLADRARRHDDDAALPGNMFVPIDAAEADARRPRQDGQRAGPARPWLGVAADECRAGSSSTRVSPDGPATGQGCRPATSSSASAATACARRPSSIARSGPRRRGHRHPAARAAGHRRARTSTVHSIDRVDYFRPQTTY